MKELLIKIRPVGDLRRLNAPGTSLQYDGYANEVLVTTELFLTGFNDFDSLYPFLMNIST